MKASYGDMLVIAPFEVINFLSKNLSVIKNEKDCISFMVDVEGKKHKVRIIHAWYEEDRRDAVKGKPVARRSKK